MLRSRQYDILIVDDDADDRMILGEAFAELRCLDRVTMYNSGDYFLKELDELKNLSPLPLLIVLDYNLPGINGAELLQIIKKDTILGAVPVVMYSTGMSRTLQTECLNAGAVKCFEKGNTYDQLICFARQLCNETEKISAPACNEAATRD